MLPGIGGHVISLRDLAILIGFERPVYGLQPTGHDLDFWRSQGRGTGERTDQADETGCESGPYNLLGFSAGGVIAYEIAQQLTVQASRLDCSDCSIPMAQVIPADCHSRGV